MLPTITKADDTVFSTHVRNLIDAHNSATADQLNRGRAWYLIALLYAASLSSMSGYSVEQCAGVIAAMSPQKEWKLNKRLARDAVLGKVHGQVRDSCRKAIRILEGEDPRSVLPTGKKTWCFFLNIIGELDEFVTIDRHAARAIDPSDADADSGLKCEGRYAYAAHVYREAARVLGIEVAILQAIVWTVRVDAFQWVRKG